jgi:hypothetical protein
VAADYSRIFLPWRWRRFVLPKRWFNQDLHGAKSQKTAFFSNLHVYRSENIKYHTRRKYVMTILIQSRTSYVLRPCYLPSIRSGCDIACVTRPSTLTGLLALRHLETRSAAYSIGSGLYRSNVTFITCIILEWLHYIRCVPFLPYWMEHFSRIIHEWQILNSKISIRSENSAKKLDCLQAFPIQNSYRISNKFHGPKSSFRGQ